LITGGDVATNVGLATTVIYDPVSQTWQRLPDMNAGRWYPTNTTLANGDVLVVSGLIDPSTGNNTIPQVWQVASQSWHTLSSAAMNLGLYPMMFAAPNGKVFNAGANKMTRYLDTTGTGAWQNVASSNFGTRDYGSAVLYDSGKVLLVGGGDPPTATAEVIDLNAAKPAWRYTNPMHYARRQLNATLLPDGTILVTGGSSCGGFNDSSCPVLPAEVWDPSAETWAVLDSLSIYRGYHSVALLLPDGRVFSGGGGINSGEVFSPPYLFQGYRPSITSAPSSVTFGQTFFVATPDSATISKVTFIRLSSVTHAFNQNQRLSYLAFAQTTGGLNITAPANGNVAPPGHYLLFLVDNKGVPTLGRMVRIDTSIASPPVAPTSLTATPVSTKQINLSWSDSANDETGFKIERSTDGSTFTRIAAISNSSTTYSDAGLNAGIRYYYRVQAYNVDADSGYSNVANATTPSVAALTATPDSLEFGSQVVSTTSSGQSVTLSNNQKTALNIASIATNGDFTQNNNCVTPLAAGGVCTIVVSFVPTALGARTGTLTISDDAPGSPQLSSLSGTGVPPVTLFPGSAMTFGAQVVGTTSPTKSLTLTNSQSVSLIFNSFAISGDYAQTNNCGTQIGPNSKCTFSITMTPTSLGNRTGTLTIVDNANNSPQVVSLAGVGVAPVSLALSSVAFGNVVVGTNSQAQGLRLTNNQTVPLNISSIAVTGDYSQTNSCPRSLAGGSACVIYLTFTPPTTGKRPGTVTITDDASNSPQAAALTGNGVVAAKLSASNLSFSSNVVVGTTTAGQTLTLKNNQTVALNITSIVTTGDFAQTNTCGTSLAAGASCAITVTFTPSTTGLHNGTLTVTDDANTSPQRATMTGTGVLAAKLSANALAFGTVAVGITSPPQSITLKNNQAISLNVSSITATGDFSQTNNCASPLAAGASCTIAVIFTPTAATSRTGVLFVADDANNSPQTATLSGTGN